MDQWEVPDLTEAHQVERWVDGECLNLLSLPQISYDPETNMIVPSTNRGLGRTDKAADRKRMHQRSTLIFRAESGGRFQHSLGPAIGWQPSAKSPRS